MRPCVPRGAWSALQPRAEMGPDEVKQLREDLRCARDDVAGLQVAVVTAQVADETACFTDEQRAGRHVPRAQADFPEAVEPSCRDIRQVERGGTGTTDAGGANTHAL